MKGSFGRRFTVQRNARAALFNIQVRELDVGKLSIDLRK
jgi:hypothetical protein